MTEEPTTGTIPPAAPEGKKKRRWLRRALTAALALVAFVALLPTVLYIPGVQRALKDFAAEKASEATGLNVEVGEVSLKFPFRMAVNGVTVTDESRDTLAAGKAVEFDVALLPLFVGDVGVRSVVVEQASYRMVSADSSLVMRAKLRRLELANGRIGLFAESVRLSEAVVDGADVDLAIDDRRKKQEAQDSSAAATWLIALNKLKIKNVRFRMAMMPAIDSLGVELGYGEVDEVSVNLSACLVRAGKVAIDGLDASYMQPDPAAVEAFMESYAPADSAAVAVEGNGKPWTVIVNKLRLSGSSALYAVSGHEPQDGLDAGYLRLDGISVAVDDFYNRGSVIRVPLSGLSARERSGLAVKHAEGVFVMDADRIAAEGFRIETERSAVEVDAEAATSALSGGDGRMRAAVSASVSPDDVGLAVPSLASLLRPLGSRSLEAGVAVEGTSRQLTVDSVGLSVPSVATLSLKGRVENLLSADGLSARLAVAGRTAGGGRLERALRLDSAVSVPAVSLRGRIDYANSSLTAKLNASAKTGEVAVDGAWDGNRESYRASAELRAFDVRSVMPAGPVGEVDGKITVDGKGYDPYTATASLAADIRSVVVDSVAYSGVGVTAKLSGGAVEARAYSGNDFARFDLSLTGEIAPELCKMRFGGKIDNVDLVAMNLAEERFSGGMSVRGGIVADFENERYGSVVRLSDIFVLLPENTFRTDSVDFGFRSDTLRTGLRVKNNDLLVNAEAPMGIARLADSLAAFMPDLDTMLVARRLDVGKLKSGIPRFKASLESGKKNLMQAYVAGTGATYRAVSLDVEKDDDLHVEGVVDNLTVAGVVFEDITVEGHTDGDRFIYRMGVANSQRNDEYVKTASLEGLIMENRLDAYLTQSDHDDRVGFDVGVRLVVEDSVATASLYPDKPRIAFLDWNVNHGNFLAYNLNNGLMKARLEAKSGDNSLISVYTEPDGEFHNAVNLNLSGINLRDWLVMSPFAPPIEGDLSAKLTVNYNDEFVWGSGDIDVNGMSYGKNRIGDFCVDARLAMGDGGRKLFATADMRVDGHQFLTVRGFRSDSIPEHTFYDLNLEIKRLPMSVASAFMAESSGQVSGYLNGKMRMTGSVDDPRLNGYLQMDSAQVKLPAFGSTLTFDDRQIAVTDNVVRFDTFNLYGVNSSPIAIDGVVRLTPLDRMYADLQVKGRNVQIVGSKKSGSSELYGKGYISLNTAVKGYMDQLDVKATVSVLSGSNLTYVYQSSSVALSESGSGDVVRFVNFSDTTAVAADSIQSQAFAMRVKAVLIIQPNAIFTVNLSPDGKNKVQIDGEGTLSYSQNDQGDMSLIGRYTVSSGYVRYSPPMMSEKLFNFNEGGTISWNGDILNPSISLSAVQSMKVNVGGGNQGSRVVPFDILLNVGNTLSSLDVSFDLSTEGDMTVANELSAMTAEQRSAQAMNLLLYGTYTGSSSSISNSLADNMAFSFLESMVNRWAASSISGVDLSFGIDQYDTTVDGATSTTTSYSYQLSKSVLNDRFKIAVGGNYMTDASAEDNLAQNLVSDISFEYKLNKKGTKYVKLFRHNEYESILEGEVTETGVGFVWKRKISSIGDMFKFLKPRKKSVVAEEKEERL